MRQLAITTLGTFRVHLNGQEVTAFETNYARALLLYLAVESNSFHRRDTLAHLFWADRSESDSRQNFRQTLHRLRRALGEEHADPAFLMVSRQHVQCNLNSHIWLDVALFTKLLLQARTAEDPLPLFQQAIELYQGDFMENVYLVNTLEFETWMLGQRQALREQALSCLEQLVNHFLQSRAYPKAEQYARRLVKLAPLEEQHHRLLMQVLAQRGQYTSALQQYETCRQFLQTELDVEPSQPTIELYQRIRSLHNQSILPITTLPACPYPGMVPFDERNHTRFFGRERELRELRDQLEQARLQTIIGASGTGKSSLVFAGLLPRLLNESHTTDRPWQMTTMRPGTRPLAALTTAWERLEQQRTVGTVLSERPTRKLLVVDQFEEVFVMARVEIEPFLQALQQFVAKPDCYVVLTVRADFYADLMACMLWSVIQKQRIELIPPDVPELRQAIVAPAKAVGVEVESALVERLLADIANEPGVLPLLQETLVQLWQRLEQRVDILGKPILVLSLAAYDALGHNGYTGVHVALANWADRAIRIFKPASAGTGTTYISASDFSLQMGKTDTRRQQPITGHYNRADDDH
ncbi:MAG: hypothetical protein HC914_18995, partial [Chloroflexaceae bacterium]|nr:hypothetical protein [Chloroflexaceae bacterium]